MQSKNSVKIKNSNIKAGINLLHDKLSRLEEELKTLRNIAVAFSGGVDSTFLLKVAKEVLGKNAAAITIDSPLYPRRELDHAIKFTADNKIKHFIIKNDCFIKPDFTKNDKLRCYYCKNDAFTKIIETAKTQGFINIADGQNKDDSSDYRPGADAALELGVMSPLKKHGFTKEDIRQLSKEMGISGWDRPAFACLASRVPYGTRITPSLLEKIDRLESFLIEKGFVQVRVRHHGKIARIEIAKEDFPGMLGKNLMEEVVSEFKKAGYIYVTLDLEGYNAGSLNRLIL
ncbi:MAG: tRNA(Ile)-lysidine synthase [Actinobacteria bacterium ADurb.Bin346]|nr:MAG: tRNA(Ile)-lysidine synthase [Actinobacteria bacterium ADurb.Bin346]